MQQATSGKHMPYCFMSTAQSTGGVSYQVFAIRVKIKATGSLKRVAGGNFSTIRERFQICNCLGDNFINRYLPLTRKNSRCAISFSLTSARSLSFSPDASASSALFRSSISAFVLCDRASSSKTAADLLGLAIAYTSDFLILGIFCIERPTVGAGTSQKSTLYPSGGIISRVNQLI